MVAAFLARVSAAGEIALHTDGAIRRIGIVILVLALELEARFIHRVIIDDNRVAQLHGVIGVRFMGGRVRGGHVGNSQRA